MIHIIFSEPDSDEWLEWKQQCEEATRKIIEDFQNGIVPNFSDLYKAQKSVFTSLDKNFFGKCAYCESLITTSQPGDIEHFRPKGNVTDSERKPIIISDQEGNQLPHPGYYWLAYSLSNLLLSCIDCNRPSKGNSGGIKVGKWEQFPVVGIYATNPGEENEELPLLINPIDENPEDHLEIDNLGIIHAKNDRGEKCIEIFGLNLRMSLIQERKYVYDNVKNKCQLLIIGSIMNSPQNQQNIEEINLYKRGVRPYSLSGRKAILDFKSEIHHLDDLLP